MVDNEMLEAIRQIIQNETTQIIDKKLEPMQADISGIKVLLDMEFRKNMDLLVEGHEMILERLPDPAEVEALDARLSAVETVVKKHSRDIQDLRKAQ